MTKDEQKVKEVLLEAQKRKRILPGQSICNITGINGTPTLRDVVHSMREQGEHICSGYNGYWYGNTDAEILQSAARLERRAFSMLRAARGMRRTLLEQIGIDLDSSDNSFTFMVGEDNLHE